MGFFALLTAAPVSDVFPHDSGSHALVDLDGGRSLMIVLFGLFALLLFAAVVPNYRGRLPHAFRDAMLWVLLFGAFLGVYAYRDSFEPFAARLVAELDPGSVITTAPGEAAVIRRADGTFVIDMVANGVRLPFVFDTGASMVVLRARGARRIGIDTDRLAYNEVVGTANGRTRAAEVEISSLSAGTVTVKNVAALVARPGTLDESLLGQSFLARLASYRVEGERLVLRSK